MRSGLRYGPNTDPPMDKVRMFTTGTPADYSSITGVFTLDIENGKPAGTAILLGAFAPDASLFKGEPFLLNTLLIVNVALPLVMLRSCTA